MALDKRYPHSNDINDIDPNDLSVLTKEEREKLQQMSAPAKPKPLVVKPKRAM